MARSLTVTVTTAATKLNAYPDPGGTSSVALSIPAGVTLYVGGDNVTAANGFPVAGSLSVDLDNQETLWGVVASGSAVINVLEMGV